MDIRTHRCTRQDREHSTCKQAKPRTKCLTRHLLPIVEKPEAILYTVGQSTICGDSTELTRSNAWRLGVARPGCQQLPCKMRRYVTPHQLRRHQQAIIRGQLPFKPAYSLCKTRRPTPQIAPLHLSPKGDCRVAIRPSNDARWITAIASKCELHLLHCVVQ